MSQQYGYPYPSSGGEGYPGIPLGVPAHETSQYNQGYYGAQSAAAPPPTGTADYGQQLIPGFPAPRNEPPPQIAGYPPRGSFPNDPYAGYDAVQYPSIPALVEHAARGGFGGNGGRGNGDASYGTTHPGSSYAQQSNGQNHGSTVAEEPGAPPGNARYRVMLLPTRDGGDIENVVCQVGLDGLKFLTRPGGGVLAGRAYAHEKIAKWRLSDPTIVSFTVLGGDDTGGSLGVSADANTMRAIMDTFTTSAFQWCELKGFDPSETIKEGAVSGEWVNAKADSGSESAGTSSALAAVRQIDWHDSPTHSGWLMKKGEHLSTWRRRWFVLKDGKLGWFKGPDVKRGVKPRGTLDVSEVQSACTSTTSDAGRKHGVELIGSAEATKAGCTFLVADSERECDQWAVALDAVINGVPTNTTPGADRSAPNPEPTGLANQLADGFTRATTQRTPQRNTPQRSNVVEVSVTGYTSGAPSGGSPSGASYGQTGGGPYGNPSSQQTSSQWETFFTNEGVPYFVNSATGVTQWETPVGVRVEM